MSDFPLDMIAEDMGTEGLGGLLIFYVIYILVMLAISVASYVLQSLSFYSIAKRREIKKPWLSWIPVANVWILGSISDQYQYVVKGKTKGKRKSLLVLNILMWVVYITFFISFFTFMTQMTGLEGVAEEMITDEVWAAVASSMVGMLALGVAMIGLGIGVIVIQYMALYDLYTSCDPRNNVMYLVLGIFVSITQPIFLFICRNKDLGMPPRKPEPSAYIPPQPPVEPWENNPEE